MKIFNLMTQSINKDGKKFYHNIGKIFQSDYEGKPSLSGYLNNNPNQKVYMFEQQPRENQAAPQQTGQQAPGVAGINFDDPTGGSDVPF